MEQSALESTQEIFELWLKAYDATMGRFVEMPAMGPAREKYDKLTKNFSIFVNLSAAWLESTVNFQQVFMEAMQRVQEKTATEIEGDISPDKYRDFYKIWIETYSETFKEFLKSGHFASDIGKFMSYFMDFQKYNREMLGENFLRPSNLPTKSEIDEIYKELYFLKKSVRELEDQIKESSKK